RTMRPGVRAPPRPPSLTGNRTFFDYRIGDPGSGCRVRAACLTTARCVTQIIIRDSRKIFVDNTKSFVVRCAHGQRSEAEADLFRAGNPARPLGAGAVYRTRSVRLTERKEADGVHHRAEDAADHD